MADADAAELETPTPNEIPDAPPVDDAAAASVSPPEQSSESAPPPPEPTPPAPRTLRDIYNDIREDKPLPPSELQQYQQYVDAENKRQSDARAQREKEASAYTNAETALTDKFVQHFGLEGDAAIVARTFVKDTLDEIKTAGAAPHTAAIDNMLGLGLWDLVRRDPQAADFIRRLPRDQVVKTAYEWGQRSAGGANLVSDDELDAWIADDKKVPANKHLTTEQALKVAEAKVTALRDSAPERYGPGPGSSSANPNRTFTTVELASMPIEDYEKLSEADRRRYWATARTG